MDTIIIIDDIKKNALGLSNALEARFRAVKVVHDIEQVDEKELSNCICVIVLSYMATPKYREQIRKKTATIENRIKFAIVVPCFSSELEMDAYRNEGFDLCLTMDSSPTKYANFSSSFESIMSSNRNCEDSAITNDKGISHVDYTYLIDIHDADIDELKSEIIPESLTEFEQSFERLNTLVLEDDLRASIDCVHHITNLSFYLPLPNFSTYSKNVEKNLKTLRDSESNILLSKLEIMEEYLGNMSRSITEVSRSVN